MGFQYKFYIEGKVYDLIPNYPQEKQIDLDVLNRLCYLLRYEQETYKRPKLEKGHDFENYKGYIEHLLKTRQDEIIQEIHCGCYERTILKQTTDREEILFQYLFQKEKLKLKSRNKEMIHHYYTMLESTFRGSLLSPYGAILLGDERMPLQFANEMLKRQLTSKTELKTRFLNGRMLLLLREEYSRDIKQEILNTYSNEEFIEEKKKFEKFYRGLSLAVGLLPEEKENIEIAFNCDQEDQVPFYKEYEEASKVLPLNTGNHLLLKMTRTLSLLEEEEKKRKHPPVVPVHKKRYGTSSCGRI